MAAPALARDFFPALVVVLSLELSLGGHCRLGTSAMDLNAITLLASRLVGSECWPVTVLDCPWQGRWRPVISTQCSPWTANISISCFLCTFDVPYGRRRSKKCHQRAKACAPPQPPIPMSWLGLKATRHLWRRHRPPSSLVPLWFSWLMFLLFFFQCFCPLSKLFSTVQK